VIGFTLHFMSGELNLGTHGTGVWVGVKTGLDLSAKGEILPLPGIESRSSNP